MSETPIDSTPVETTPVKKPGLPRRTVILAGLLALVGVVAVVTTLKRVMTPVAESPTPVAAVDAAAPSATQPPAVNTGAAGSEEWRKRPSVLGIFATPPDLKLNDEQMANLNAVREEMGPLVFNAMLAFDQSVTPQQAKAREEASKVVNERGLKGQEAVDVIFEAMALTDSQKRFRENFVKVREEAQAKVFAAIRPTAAKNPEPK